VKNTSFILDLKIIHKTSVQTISALVESSEAQCKNVYSDNLSRGRESLIETYGKQLAEA